MSIWATVLREEDMTEEEFAEEYQKHRDRLLSYITLRGDVDEDTADEILHRAMFGRPTRTNGISAGMYGKRQEIQKADFRPYAYGCVKIEIRDWHREHKRMLSFQDLAFQDENGKIRIGFALLTRGSPGLVLYDKKGKVIWSAP